MTPHQDERLVVAFERIGTALLRIAAVAEAEAIEVKAEKIERAEETLCPACTHRASDHNMLGCQTRLSPTVHCTCRRSERSLL